MGGGDGGRAVISSFIWVLRVHYEGVAGYHLVLAPSRQVVPAASRWRLDWVRAATVKFLNETIGSARLSGTHICGIVSGSFVFSYSVPPGTPQYGIYSDRTVIGRWRRIDLHPKWFVAYKDTRAMYDPRSYELNSTHPSVYGHPPPTTPLSFSFAPPRPTTPNSPE